jgi:GNAT superfamily N-acetyltransferase
VTEVRRLDPSAWTVLRDVRLAALADASYAFNSTLADATALDEGAWRGRLADQACFVAFDGDAPVGLAQGGATRDGDPARRTLRSMWVAPAHRGSDVAVRLVDEVVAWARDDGAHTLVLWALVPAERARAFYVRYGFSKVADEQPDDRHPEMSRFELDLNAS